MVRKGGAKSTQWQASTLTNPNPNGTGNGQIPPSTIAAQIVSNATNTTSNNPNNNNAATNLTGGAAQQQPQDPGTTGTNKIPFPDLLREFLRNPIIDDLDPQLNVQFISTIVEAGLDPLKHNGQASSSFSSSSNPFTPDRSRELAVDSLKAIGVSVWQIPQLLLSSRASGKEGDDGVGSEPPVFLWLFTKVVGLVEAGSRFEGLADGVREVLGTFLLALGRNEGLWRWEEVVGNLYRGCVDGWFSSLMISEVIVLI